MFNFTQHQEHFLFHGDCLNVMPILPVLTGKVDMVLTDPPYGTTACKWDSIIPLDQMWINLKTLVKPNAAVVLCGSEPFSSILRTSNMRDYKYDWFWNKSRPVNFLNAKKQPLRKVETISVFNERGRYFPQGLIRKPRINKRVNSTETNREHGLSNYSEFTNYPHNILKFPHDKGSKHPTQKPVALMEYLIRTYTNEGDTVLDFTMGSGTTGVACQNTGRRFIGIELDPVYFTVACGRMGVPGYHV